MGKSCPGKGGFESAGVSSTSTPTSTWKPGATTQRCAADTTVGEATQLLNQYLLDNMPQETYPGWLVMPAWLAAAVATDGHLLASASADSHVIVQVGRRTSMTRIESDGQRSDVNWHGQHCF